MVNMHPLLASGQCICMHVYKICAIITFKLSLFKAIKNQTRKLKNILNIKYIYPGLQS